MNRKNSKPKPKVWHKVKAPSKWMAVVGEEIEGEYIGSKEREGQFGKYSLYLIRMKNGAIRYVSGTVVNDLFSVVPVGTRVRLVFLGEHVAVNTGRIFKQYELYTEEAIELRVTG